MNKFLFILSLFIFSLTIKLSYDPKKGYYYTIQGDSPEQIIDADLKLKSYIKKGIIPNQKKDEKTK